MAGALYSPSWHRVSGLRPRLRAHVRIHRHTYRGGVWYVVQDNQTGRFHRLSPAAYHVVCLMDGRRTVEQIWDASAHRLGAEQPTQSDIVSLLALLHGADLVLGGVPPHMEELDERARRTARRDLMSRIKNPLALRFRLFDPDRFLTATLPLVRPLFSLWGLAGWGLLVLAGALLAAINWQGLSTTAFDQVLTTQNLFLLFLTYPLVKAVHELGHAYATRVWGGEVHELGVMVLVLMPVPYVDASASAAFRDKWRRAVVGAAGIMVELALASLAMVVWVLAEPGLLRAIAFNVAIIGGVSTLLFNGNPLLRFDGYYVLCDLVEIPNLAQRANRYVLHLVQRFGFALPDLETPVTAPGEERWFLFYAIASFFYRLSVTIGIAMYIAGHYFFIGVLLALVSVYGALVLPVLKGLRYLLFDRRLSRNRMRAMLVSAASAGVAALVLLVIPLPYSTVAEGVVWVDDDAAAIRTRSEGIVSAIAALPAGRVEQGATLVAMEDPVLAAKAVLAEKQLEELRIRYEIVNLSDRVQASILREQIRSSEGQLADMQRSLADLEVKAARAGTFLPLEVADLPGRFQRKGDLLGYVLGVEGPVVRAIVPQTEIDLVRRNTTGIMVRLVTDTGHSLEARLARDVPAAVTELPHGALAPQGGGHILVDPAHPDRLKPLESVFQIDVRVRDLPPQARLGMRAHVRFDHPAEAIGLRLARTVRQVFLRQFQI